MKESVRVAAVGALALVAACGKPLGEYQVRQVSLVTGAMEPDRYAPSKDDEPMLRVEFTSKSDLYERSDGGGEGLYVFASFCPYDEDRTLYVGEPYYNDRGRYGPSRLQSKVLPDGNVIEVADMEERRPAKDSSGAYVYTTYLAVRREGAPERPGRSEQPPYDLREHAQDLCLRINHPGYFITPSQSLVFTVPAAMIRGALLRPIVTSRSPAQK